VVRIGVVAPVWIPVPPSGYGGIEQVVSLLVEELVARGHDVTLFASGDSKTTALLRSVYAEAPTSRLGTLEPHASHVGAAFRAAAVSYRDGEGFDLLHDHTSYLGVAFAATLDTPVVHTEHFVLDGEREEFLRRFKDDTYLTAISQYQVQECPELPWRGVVHNAIDAQVFPYVEEKEEFVLSLGRVASGKGQDLAIRAARQAGVPLVIAGRVAPGEADFFKTHVLPYIDDVSVRFLGEVPHSRKLELLSAARALLFPIREPEPFGLVMVEALACGTPVVAQPLGAAREVVADGVTGFLASGPEALAAALGRLGEISPRACREDVEARFHPRSMVDGYEALYRGILAEL
jgi:glycosyltransferase involved in cell wall biosynthesis